MSLQPAVPRQISVQSPPQWQSPQQWQVAGTPVTQVLPQVPQMAPLSPLEELGPPPKRQTENMPTPASIANQKEAYSRALDQQLESGAKTIHDQKTQALDILRNAAEEKKMKFTMQIEEEMLQKEFELDENTHAQIMQLQQAAFQQKSQLEHQASQLIMEYKQRFMQEQMQQRLYEQKMRQHQMRETMQQKMKDVSAKKAAAPPSPSSPQVSMPCTAAADMGPMLQSPMY
ncbi:unnamed protein product [Cladocopium goreaui]|uniref:Uncharacterized protein n=1 Tax=Cladocopium goreaui TaxID=2562237 RepID=A0A9P1DLL1_9DINO|nr:unnamed protein product [Cladocopium goreaui]